MWNLFGSQTQIILVVRFIIERVYLVCLKVSKVGWWMFQTLSFYFMECGEIPPPVVQVQNVSFRYKDTGVSFLGTDLHLFSNYILIVWWRRLLYYVVVRFLS